MSNKEFPTEEVKSGAKRLPPLDIGRSVLDIGYWVFNALNETQAAHPPCAHTGYPHPWPVSPKWTPQDRLDVSQ